MAASPHSPSKPPHGSKPPVRRRRKRDRIFTWRNGVILAIIAGVMLTLHFMEFEWRDVPGMLEQVNRPLALLIMAALPIIGFPISAVYLAAGALFGPGWGGLVVAGISVCHISATHVLARTLLRGTFERWRTAWSKRLPAITEGDNVSMVAMIVLVPGLPYIARNILLSVSNVPLRYLLGVGVPLYVMRSYTTLYLGNAGADPSLNTLIILGVIFVVKLGISALLLKRLLWHSSAAERARRKHASTRHPLPATGKTRHPHPVASTRRSDHSASPLPSSDSTPGFPKPAGGR